MNEKPDNLFDRIAKDFVVPDITTVHRRAALHQIRQEKLQRVALASAAVLLVAGLALFVNRPGTSQLATGIEDGNTVTAVDDSLPGAPNVTTRPEVSVDTEIPTPNTLYELDWSETWSTREKRPTLGIEASPALVPVSGPSGQEADITFNATSSGGEPGVDLVVRWDDTDSGIASLGITRTNAVEPLVCHDLRNGGSYASITILNGSIEGCGFTNEVGGFFLRWNADGDSYLYQSGSLTEQQSLDYLDSWEHL